MKALEHFTYEAEALAKEFPPKFWCERKQAIYANLLASQIPFKGEISAIRWEAPKELPVTLPSIQEEQEFCIVPGLFDYASETDRAKHWYMNFADPQLFAAYPSPLLAQDELQVLEHPLLASLREALIVKDLSTSVEDYQERPTPFTISGVQRSLRLDPKARLYGNAFEKASIETLRGAVTFFDPPRISNILAIAAPSGGKGRYTLEEIHLAFLAAYTGFCGAREHLPEKQTVIHTGFWGCGAFGGNRHLMTILQAAAAQSAQVSVQFHAVDHEGAAVAEEAYNEYTRLVGQARDLPNLLDLLHQQGFVWGVPNGT